MYFSADKIATTMVEVFCKTIMLYIAQKPRELACYIMITDCTQSHFVEITRMLALFYDKQGVNSLMNKTQIFLSGKQPGEEFLISGCNLGEVIGSTEKLAFSRCVNPDCLRILKKMLKNRRGGMTPNGMVSIVPFDMIRYEPKKPTLFESNLRQVLETEVQSERFGCRIDNLHVRIGSKIHIKKFYEAELLLHNNYYTSRFAYWLFEEICANENINPDKQITLVGYENYSEMLLNELREMLKVKGIDTEYIIYEQKATEKFRYVRTLSAYKDSQFILVVPINSTLTTHIKVAGFLEKSIKEELRRVGDQTFTEYNLSKVIYYGIILVAPTKGCQNEYWRYSETSENTLISNINQKEMKYYMMVQTKWSHPLRCKECFPLGNYTREIPLIETNKESVIPMQAIGMRRKIKPEVKKIIDRDQIDRIKELSKLLVYRHVERNGNHFNYYFHTERLWDYPEIRKNIQDWLKEKSKLFPLEDKKTYDIIVAPLHYSNTAFVEEVNHCLFQNVALVLHFDVDKEFRMNVMAKYSSIQQLYDNLCEGDEESIINFHYVDDTIVSGRTYHRTKSMIRSLITPKPGAKITINLFKSVVILLNRMSSASIREYMEKPQYFLFYFDLNISSMRVNADACVLCKKHAQWNDLAKQASLNEVYLYWKEKSAKLECISVESLNKVIREESPDKRKRAEQYMLASHRAKGLLQKICSCCSNEEIENEIVEKLFPESIKDSFDELIAVLKVLGRPFLTFRRESKEAVFHLMLNMLEQLLSESKPQGSNKIQIIIRDLWESPVKRTESMIILINRLAELESNYIIRKKNLKRLLDYACNHLTKEESECFKNNYLNRIKQLVGQSNDFAKGLFLEYLLLYDKEYNGNYNCEMSMTSLLGSGDMTIFKRKVYLENTKLINYGIEALAWNFESDDQVEEKNLVKALKENYYLDNFVQYLTFHKMIRVDMQGEVIEFVSSTHAQKLEAMVRFQMLYHEVFQESEEAAIDTGCERRMEDSDENLKNIFQRMLKCLQMASGALDAEIIVPYRGSIENVDKYIALEFGTGTDLRGLCDEEEMLSEFMKNNSEYEGNTYNIKEWGKRQWIIIKFFDEARAGSSIPIIFLVFPFNEEQKKQIVHSLKNILIFRDKTWRLLNLSSSTLLQNWTENLYYKQQMLKDRATSHAECVSLHKILEGISEMICDPKNENELFCEYFNMTVNSLIGYMNAQVLGGKGKDFFAARSAKLKNLKGDQKIYDAMCQMWDMKLDIAEDLADKEIRKGTEVIKKIPEMNAIRVLFLAVFQNVLKHGKKNEEGKFLIKIYGEGDRLCIANEIDDNKEDAARQSINPDEYRRRNGISQAVIFDLCRSWYSESNFTEFFKMEQDRDSNRWNYVVKLPIIKKEGAE